MQAPKVESVQDWPQPKTVSEVRQFLGLSGYYRRFVKDYASIARPMIDLTKKDQSDKDGKITWTTDHQISFDKLKDTLCSAPVLAIPDIRRGKFHINCDASTFGLGATLFQDGEDGLRHPCGFISRVLTPSESNNYKKYKCVYELELKALIFALDKWRQYLEGQPGTTVDTDHKSLI